MNDPRYNQLVLKLMLADMPAWACSLYIHMIVELLYLSQDDGNAVVSIEDLAERFKVSRRTIERALKVMCHSQHRWVSKKSGKRGYRANTYAVNVGMLPVDRAVIRRIISLEATNLAFHYHGLVKAMPKTLSKTNPASGRMVSVRIAADWQQRWERNAQRWLDEGYTYDQIKAVIDRAFATMGDTAKHGMQTLRGPFTRLLAESERISAPDPVRQLAALEAPPQ